MRKMIKITRRMRKKSMGRKRITGFFPLRFFFVGLLFTNSSSFCVKFCPVSLHRLVSSLFASFKPFFPTQTLGSFTLG